MYIQDPKIWNVTPYYALALPWMDPVMVQVSVVTDLKSADNVADHESCHESIIQESDNMNSNEVNVQSVRRRWINTVTHWNNLQNGLSTLHKMDHNFSTRSLFSLVTPLS